MANQPTFYQPNFLPGCLPPCFWRFCFGRGPVELGVTVGGIIYDIDPRGPGLPTFFALKGRGAWQQNPKMASTRRIFALQTNCGKTELSNMTRPTTSGNIMPGNRCLSPRLPPILPKVKTASFGYPLAAGLTNLKPANRGPKGWLIFFLLPRTTRPHAPGTMRGRAC